jgi:hypothetical protein
MMAFPTVSRMNETHPLPQTSNFKDLASTSTYELKSFLITSLRDFVTGQLIPGKKFERQINTSSIIAFSALYAAKTPAMPRSKFATVAVLTSSCGIKRSSSFTATFPGSSLYCSTSLW